jgi:HEAT repeat protein
MGTRRWIFRATAGTGLSVSQILALLYLAGAFVVPPSARAQDDNDRLERNLHDLKSKNADVRAYAAEALGEGASPDFPVDRREPMRKAIPALMEALTDNDPEVRLQAANALGNIPGDMRVAVPPLIKALRDKDNSVREHAAQSLGNIGQSAELAVPALIAALQDKNESVRERAAESLGSFSGSAELAVPALVGALKRNDDRTFASDALIKFGPAASPAVPDLIALLQEKDPHLPWYVAPVLGAIGPKAQAAEPALVNLLRGTDEQGRLEAANALGKIGRDHQPEAVAVATRLLEAQDYFVRDRAAGVLGNAGVAAEPSIAALTKSLDDENEEVRMVAATSLSRIALKLRNAREIKATESLQTAAIAMDLSKDRRVKARAGSVADAAAALEALRNRDIKWQVLHQIRRRPRVASAVVGYLALALLWTCLLWLSPLSLLRINDALAGVPKVKLPGWLGGMEISISNLLLVGFFNHSDRVLDAWVGKHIEKARASFESNETIMKCTDQVPGPMLLGREILPALSVSAVRPAFARPKTSLLIWGSDDSRNANLAYEIARWSMESDPGKRLRKNLMIAVRVEQTFAYTADKDKDPFTTTVRDNLQMDEDPPSLELVARLLRRKRVLVVVLGFSELNQPTLSSIQPGSADFPANALVVTSRVEEALGGTTKTMIRFCEEIRP